MMDLLGQLLELTGLMLVIVLLVGLIAYKFLSALAAVFIKASILFVKATKKKLKKAWKRLRDIVRGREPEKPTLQKMSA